jgi:putative protease
MAIDSYYADRENYKFDPLWMRELESVSHREYCTGFYFDYPINEAQLASNTGYIREKAYFATALSKNDMPVPSSLAEETENGKLYPFIQRNKIKLLDSAEIISPSKIGKAFTVTELYNDSGEPIESAPHPSQKFFVRVPFEVSEGDIIRSGE